MSAADPTPERDTGPEPDPSDEPDMTPERERSLYLRGIDLFNERDFFEAHETWEDVWRAACGRKYDFYQGLIQCAVALEHYRRSNPRGVASLYRSYRPRFRGIEGVFMGIDVPAFLEGMRRAVADVADADPLPPRGSITLDMAKVPTITLLYDPFETGEALRYNRIDGF